MNPIPQVAKISATKSAPSASKATHYRKSESIGFQQPSPATYYATNGGITLIPYGWVYSPAPFGYQPVYYSTPMVAPLPKYIPKSQAPVYNIPKYQPNQFDSQLISKYSVPSYGYASMGQQKPSLDFSMNLEELYTNIKIKIKVLKKCKITWLNRMIAKVNDVSEFEKAFEIFVLFQEHALETTSETGTLLIKAACRAGIPEKALEIVKDIDRIQVSPTIGGVHYLMINFSLKKDSKSVFESYEIFKLRDINPNARTFHILIRECVDNGLMEQALQYAKECQDSQITPNRVIINILMNGCRKFNKPKLILELRSLMQKHNIEINDTTCKFTALAYMMLGDVDKAVSSFLEFPELAEKKDEYCRKFFELEDENQKSLVASLFENLAKRSIIKSSLVTELINVKNFKTQVEETTISDE